VCAVRRDDILRPLMIMSDSQTYTGTWCRCARARASSNRRYRAVIGPVGPRHRTASRPKLDGGRSPESGTRDRARSSRPGHRYSVDSGAESRSAAGAGACSGDPLGDLFAKHDVDIKTAFGGNRGGQSRMIDQAYEEVFMALEASNVLVEEEKHGRGLDRLELLIDGENGPTNPVPLLFAALPAEGRGK
jgi:hypothetical protein